MNVGIDFGASTIAIAYDNGVRTHIAACAGFPKDDASRKKLGKEIVFGDEVLRNTKDINLYCPIEKGILKFSDNSEKNPEGYEKTISVSRDLLKHLMDHVTEGKAGDFAVRGVIGVPTLASQKNKKALIEISKEILDSVMIVPEPFSVAYGLNLLYNTLIIDIGAGTVDLCRMHGTIPSEEDQITTFKAGNYIDQVFFDLIMKKYNIADLKASLVKKLKEDNAFVTKPVERVLIDFTDKEKPVYYDVTDELREACRSIVPEIVKGIDKLVTTFNPEFQDELKENVLLTGGGSQIIGLRSEIENYMKENLGYGRVKIVDEPLYAGTNGALKLCKDMQDEHWRELKNIT